MEGIETIWQSYNDKLEKSLSINQRIIEEIQKQKTHTVLKSLKSFKIFAIILGFLWLFFLAFLLVNSLVFSKIFFVVSVALLLAGNLMTIAAYIYHVILINQINNTENIIEAQKKLAKLQASTLWIVRFLLLQLPLYTTWFISFDWIKNSPRSFWFIEVPIVFLFTFLGIWLYRNIKYENRDKKWFKILFGGKEWNAPIKAAQFLKEIEMFEK